MMQPAVSQSAVASMPPSLIVAEPPFSPAAMARYLRRTTGAAALCFAQAIYEDSAWANDDWGAYWADVVRLV